jgi:hypothetical protein
VKPRLVAAAVFALLEGQAESAPWAMGAGRFFARFGYQGTRSTTLAAPDGTQFDIPRFSTDDLDLSLGYGLDDRFTLTTNLPVLRSSDLDDTPDELVRESGFGDLQVGLEAQLLRRGLWVMGARALVQAPTGDAERADGLQPTGSGIWEGELALSAGGSLWNGRGFVAVEAGYRYRASGFQDAFVFSTQVGYLPTPRLTLAMGLRGNQPFRYPDGSFGGGGLTGVGNGVTYVNYGPTASVKLGRGLGLEVGLEGTFHARNIATGTLFRAALTFQH